MQSAKSERLQLQTRTHGYVCRPLQQTTLDNFPNFSWMKQLLWHGGSASALFTWSFNTGCPWPHQAHLRQCCYRLSWQQQWCSGHCCCAFNHTYLRQRPQLRLQYLLHRKPGRSRSPPPMSCYLLFNAGLNQILQQHSSSVQSIFWCYHLGTTALASSAWDPLKVEDQTWVKLIAHGRPVLVPVNVQPRLLCNEVGSINMLTNTIRDGASALYL